MIRLQQRPLLGFLVDPFGLSARAMALDEDHIRITRRGQVTTVSLQALTQPPALRKGMLGTALTINSQEHNDVTLKGAGNVAAREFAEEVKEAWTRFNLAALDKEAARLDRVLAGVLALAAPSRYPSACLIAPLMDDARALDASLLSKLNAEAIGPDVVAEPGMTVIDATGRFIMPGIIDTHTHYDAQPFWDKLCTSSIWHGVTTVLMGNCGLTLAPIKKGDEDAIVKSFVRVEAIPRHALEQGVKWNWHSYGEYLDNFEGKVGINVGGLVGHIAVRHRVMGEAAVEREGVDGHDVAPHEGHEERRRVEEDHAARGGEERRACAALGCRHRRSQSRRNQ